jgi:3-oxoacyl-[acyl-carrier protein] reductase
MQQIAEQTCKLPADLLRGQVALVTGGSRGIGRATALRLAEAGANVVINYLEHHADAQSVVDELRDVGIETIAVQGNVSRSEDAETIVDAALQEFGQLDILVANAGIWQGAPVEEISDDLWDRVLDANLRGTWTCCRAAIPVMKSAGRGSIVIVSSTAGQRGEAGYSNYAASKGGQISFAKSLASELAPNIRVNCVAPGWVDTDMNNKVFASERAKQAAIQGIPLKRIATADDVALAIAYLASDWSRHVTGEVLNVNGGAVLCG